MDGWITIGTKLDTNKFDKEITELENKIKKEEEKKIIIEGRLDLQTQQLEEARRKTDELGDAYHRLKALQDQISAGKATPAQFEAASNIQQQYGSLEKISASLDKAITKQDELDLKVQKTKNDYEGTNSKVDGLKNKIEGVRLEKQQTDAKQLSENLKQAGASVGDLAKTKLGAAAQMGEKLTNSFRNTLKTIGKIVIGIIGIRAGLAMVRRASSELGQYDSQYKANIDYIRFALTNAIAPVLRWIVSAVATVLGYINTIFSTLFGINLLGNSSAKAFQNMSAGAGGAASSVKEIKKELAGFDEMNVLSDQDTGGGGGGRRWWHSCTRLRFIRNAT